jgi:subtilase family serine protease
LKKIVMALAACAAATAFLVSSATGANGRATLAGSVPSWATAANWKATANSSSYVNFRVYLAWRNSSDAASLAQAVSTPGNASYGKFLTPGQFQAQFSPAPADVNAVRSWLQSQDLTVDYTPTNNHYIAAEGTVAQVEAAFNVQLNEYKVNGLTLRAPSSALTIPSSLGGTVDGVIGVDQSMALLQPYILKQDPNASPSAGFRNAPPLSNYWAEKTTANTPPFLPNYRGEARPWATKGYSPAQVRGAYGLSGLSADGSGSTVAVVDAYASPTIEFDVNHYSQLHGLPTFKSGQFVQVVAPGTYNHPESGIAQDPQGWYGEETLDVEAVHSMAPAAKIVYFGTPNNYRDLDALLNHVVDRRIADIVTNSYGYSSEFLPPGYIVPLNETFIQGALEGMSFLFSSGDSGDETLGTTTRTATADWPASSPWVTAVGGTSLAVGQSNNYLFETAWGTSRNRLNCTGFLSTVNAWCSTETYLYGSGGGTSRIFAEPSYQQGIVPSVIANRWGSAGRAVPDVSAVGDPNTGFLVGQTQRFSDGTYYDEFRLGGTSLSSPLMAGMLAVAQQLRGGQAFGFANPILYSLPASAYHDIVAPASTVAVVRADYVNSENDAAGILYSIRRMSVLNTLRSIPGYDDSTGLGTPNGSAFFTALASK